MSKLPVKQPFDGANGVVSTTAEIAALKEQLAESEFKDAQVVKTGKHFYEVHRLSGGQLYIPALGKEQTEKLGIRGKVRVSYLVVTNERILQTAIEKGVLKARGIWVKFEEEEK